MSNIKLITETTFDTKSSLIECETGDKQWFIEGIYAQANLPNRNRRIYSEELLDREFTQYDENIVKTNRALGELNHPAYLEPNPKYAAHRIVEIQKDGENYMGKALVLNTPEGNIVKGLLEGGTQLGVSTRGAGTLRESTTHKGIQEVNMDFKLSCVDTVLSPSGIDCWVNGIYEGEDWAWASNERAGEEAKKLIEEKRIIEAFSSFLKNIRTK